MVLLLSPGAVKFVVAPRLTTVPPPNASLLLYTVPTEGVELKEVIVLLTTMYSLAPDPVKVPDILLDVIVLNASVVG